MAKRMILMDPRMLKPDPPVPEPVPDALRRLDNAMESVMHNPYLALSDKVSRYNEVLSDYLKMVKEYRSEGGRQLHHQRHQPHQWHMEEREQEEEEEERQQHPQGARLAQAEADGEEGEELSSKESRVIDVIPTRYKPKAKRLLNFISYGGVMDWTDRGELKVDGKVYENSHIADLVNQIVNPAAGRRKKGGPPEGWEAFAKTLKESNVPQELLTVYARDELRRIGERRFGGYGDSSSEGVFSALPTPPLSVKKKGRWTSTTFSSPKTVAIWTPYHPRGRGRGAKQTR